MKLTADIDIKGEVETVWHLSQTPDQHARWDVRFTNIEYLPKERDEELQRFRYSTRMGFGLTVEGWGESIGGRDHRSSSLRFGSDDPKSIIREGAGSWVYAPNDDGAHFSTVYDYEPRYGLAGRAIDTVVFRPLMQWATRWSFDRLRLWIERGLAPEAARRLWTVKFTARIALGLVWIIEGVIPKILFVSPGEIELVRKSGLYWPTPEGMLAIIGAAEIIAGLWLLSGVKERAAALAVTIAMLVLVTVVVATDATMLINPLGGISKNLGLIAAAVTIWMLEPVSPKASRARKRK
jgi:uncharacterized membrane protein YphA (DoxX/SURF4 family)